MPYQLMVDRSLKTALDDLKANPSGSYESTTRFLYLLEEACLITTEQAKSARNQIIETLRTAAAASRENRATSEIQTTLKSQQTG